MISFKSRLTDIYLILPLINVNIHPNIKAKVRLSYGHDGASFVMDALIILPSGEFVNRHFAILQKKAKPRCGHPAERGKSMGASKIVFFDFITFRQQIRSKIQKSISYNIVTMKRKKQEYYGKQHV
jgi:hypothetical protein